MKTGYTVEVCASSAESCIAAELGGADRVELCSALSEGGLTPSAGETACARKAVSIALHVLIRPRPGDFVYSSTELAAMEYDISAARDLGADGVVFGCLTEYGDIDMKAVKRLVKAADGLSVTFHRAFDMAADPFSALDRITDSGCNRILTSGQSPTAEEGISLLGRLVAAAGSRITIMPGCGISESNISRIASLTKAREFHFSAREYRPGRMKVFNPNVHMGAPDGDERGYYATSSRRVENIIQSLYRETGEPT